MERNKAMEEKKLAELKEEKLDAVVGGMEGISVDEEQDTRDSFSGQKMWCPRCRDNVPTTYNGWQHFCEKCGKLL